MAIYLGSELVGLNTTYTTNTNIEYAYWMGQSISLYIKSTSTNGSGVAQARVNAPTGCSLYRGGYSTSFLTRTYSTSAPVRNSSFYYIRGTILSNVTDINNYRYSTFSTYQSSMYTSISTSSISSMFVLGAGVLAFGITDTIITDSTLIYSRSTGTSTFFTGIISPFNKINAPLLQNIPTYAFSRHHSLISASFPACISIESSAFNGCNLLSSISFPVCTSIGESAFYGCDVLASINFPACTYIGSGAFRICHDLSSISFPACISIGENAFYNCYKLSSISFPVCTSIGAYAFYQCSTLTSINCPICTFIGSSAFGFCYQLISLNLNNVSSVPTLDTIGAFYSTPIGGYSTSAGRYGSVYVPASLYNDFLTATNWSDISARIVSV